MSTNMDNVEIRNLKEGTLYNLIQILDTNDDWKRFMSLIPKDLQSDHFVPKYNNEHTRSIEEYSRTAKEKCTKILLDEWGTSGRVRPTLRTIMKIGMKAEMIRVTDEVARLLGEAPPPRPREGPAASIDTSISRILQESELHHQPTALVQTEKSASDLIKFSGNTVSQDGGSISQTTDENISGYDNSIQDSEIQDRNQSQNDDHQGYSGQPAWSKLMIDPSPQLHNQTGSEDSYGNFQKSFPNVGIFLSSQIDKSILQDNNLRHFDYEELRTITNNFCDTIIDRPQGPIGKIGQGGFGEVFVGHHPEIGLLAIKRTHENIFMKPEVAVKVFNSEVKFLAQFRHNNIVPIIGYSKDGPGLCIICEYIDGGSLEQKLAEKVLTEKQRINIIQGTAEGLQYLHSYELLGKGSFSDSSSSSSDSSRHNVSKTHFVHRDVKSANILLTKDFVPKLCDFGLAKQFENDTAVTSALMGTRAYMAPEGVHGTITQKIDIYSYGIVLLEILTGLECIVQVNNEPINIRHYIDDMKRNGKTITDLLDPFAGVWTKGDKIYNLAHKCLAENRHDRPSINEICQILHSIDDN